MQQPKLAKAFLEHHAGRPLMLEVKACGMAYGRPGASALFDGVAVVYISGLLTASEPWWGTTYTEIRQQVQAALDNPEAKAILLHIDSPGGGTDEAFETAEFIRAANEAKPIWAVSNVNCYSAAYLLAAGCERIIAAPFSGGVGSIGIYAEHMDMSSMLEKAGVKVTLISAGEGKTAGNPYEPLSDGARETFQAEVDRQYDLFVAHVARGRGMEEKAIRAMGAALKPAEQAVEAGLADAIGEANAVLADMAAKIQTVSASASAVANHAKGGTNKMGAELLRKKAGAGRAAEEEEPKSKKRAMEDEEDESAMDDETDESAEGDYEEEQASEDEEDEPVIAKKKGKRGEEKEDETSAAVAIAEMCAMAGIAGKTPAMLKAYQRTGSMASVRKQILAAKADAAPSIRSSYATSGDRNKKNPLLAAVDNLKSFYGAIARQGEAQ